MIKTSIGKSSFWAISFTYHS